MIEEMKKFPSILACIIREIYRHVLDILDKEQNVMKLLKFCRLEYSRLGQRISLGKCGCLGGAGSEGAGVVKAGWAV